MNISYKITDVWAANKVSVRIQNGLNFDGKNLSTKAFLKPTSMKVKVND